MTYVSTVIIGAGPAGLAMSKELGDRGIEHVLLERGAVANSWAEERWESFTLLTPNRANTLPGDRYAGRAPDGFMTGAEIVARFRDYAARIAAPVEGRTEVTSVTRRHGVFRIETTRGVYHSDALVIASGACNLPRVPGFAEALPAGISSVTPLDYSSPAQLPPGGVLVVGASATGIQLAEEIHRSGRPVTLAVGEHVRAPRRYRGRDIIWWIEQTGLFDPDYGEVDDLERRRRLPSFQLVGQPDGRTVDLNRLQSLGVQIAGRMAGLSEGRAYFSGALANVCALADLKMGRMLDAFDAWAEAQGLDLPPADRPRTTDVPAAPPLWLDLEKAGVRSVFWATGYRPDYGWLKLPVLDGKGRLQHRGGVVAPGLYAMGLPFMRSRRSTFIGGFGADAAVLADHLSGHLGLKAA